MIHYSRRALVGLAYLFRPYNDIDVYVEDDTCRNMYEVLISRMLPRGTEVSRVFQLGGRQQVIDACERNQTNVTRPQLFIVDGDFNFVLGTPPPKLKYLHQLGVYCSENLVITETAVIEVAFETLTNAARSQVQSIVLFPQFMHVIVQRLMPLLIVYIAANILDSNVKTTGFNVTELLAQRGKTPQLSVSKVNQRVAEVRRRLRSENSQRQVESAIAQARRLIPASTADVLKLFSGKTYLMPLLYHHLRGTVRFSGTLDQLKTRLARFCELDVDPDLSSAVQEASRTKLVS